MTAIDKKVDDFFIFLLTQMTQSPSGVFPPHVAEHEFL